ncbi:MAG: DNA translocase FtsK 4TM domain-containing protein, partial [Desulfobacterales bacterium]|nr:DNA translocase FtsK 4TM domain-containing protein [Desulfobacterales bacterium]
MRKEIIGILLFFLVIFMLGSLLSYSPEDPSIHNARALGSTHNLFGVFGSHSASVFIGLFGLGAFWLPILLLFASIHFFCKHPRRAVVLTIVGGILLIITTGSLLTFQQNHYLIFGSKFSSGGIIGIPLKSFLVRYANSTGAVIILILAWIIGFIIATGFSIINFIRLCWKMAIVVSNHIKTLIVIWKERRAKAKKLSKIKKEDEIKKENKIQIKIPEAKHIKNAPAPKQEVFEFMRSETGFQLPSVKLLDDLQSPPISANDENLQMQSKLLEKKLEDFSVKGKVVGILPGPVVTTFEYEPAPGVKINKIVSLTDDLALALRATSIRIVAPIPGKAVIGIEIPNSTRELVGFKEIIISSVFEKSKSYLTICLGKDIVGNPVVSDLHGMPHLLIAGATGTGKSVGLNAMICSILYKANPEDVKFIMIDPKRIELSSYDGIPHLIIPVVTNVKKA